eukprot:CAMPEP_0202475760 /NCGR_PEP_ID=MMETSP1360-20130828/93073_1 /ASSEMBLY_ACC=CAM_ASM_000848 /TAXON_ID=515479 /ORGANISM="Licmophora paradoxa, Strain CCMP2313" /LENGTH=91 /DNA_ID=CAMNT_0049102941 /DNA_START=460 /DNA_END=735 /DNA_ORIENTATION=-
MNYSTVNTTTRRVLLFSKNTIMTRRPMSTATATATTNRTTSSSSSSFYHHFTPYDRKRAMTDLMVFGVPILAFPVAAMYSESKQERSFPLW